MAPSTRPWPEEGFGVGELQLVLTQEALLFFNPAVEQAALVRRVAGLRLGAAALMILVELRALRRQKRLDLAGAVRQ